MSDKLPWFKFFPMDWETDEDVQLMDFYERGVYLALLCRTWIEGSIPANTSKAQGLLKHCLSDAQPNDKQRLENAYEKVIKLFSEHPENPGRLVHWKMEEQRQGFISLRETRRKAGSKGGKQSSSKAQAKTKQSSSEPEPESEPEVIKKKNIKKEKNRPESITQIFEYFESKGMDSQTAKIQGAAFDEYYDPEKTGRYRDRSGKLISSWKRNAVTWFANWHSRGHVGGKSRFVSADKTQRSDKPQL